MTKKYLLKNVFNHMRKNCKKETRKSKTRIVGSEKNGNSGY